MFDFLGLGFWLRGAIASITETLISILQQLKTLERKMSDLDTTINQRLDVIEGAINIEVAQAEQLKDSIDQLTVEVAELRRQLGELNPLSEATLQRIENLAGKISAIVPDVPEPTS